MSRILYANKHDLIFPNNIVYNNTFIDDSSKEAAFTNNLEDLIYYIFYREPEGRGYIVIYFKCIHIDVKFIIQIEEVAAYYVYDTKEERKPLAAKDGKYVFKYPYVEDATTFMTLFITAERFDEVIDKFKNTNAANVEKVRRYKSYKAATCFIEDNVEAAKYEDEEDARIMLYEKDMEFWLEESAAEFKIHCEYIGHIYDDNIKIEDIIVYGGTEKNPRLRFDRRILNDRGDFKFTLSSTNEIEYCGKRVLLQSRISQRGNIFEIRDAMMNEIE